MTHDDGLTDDERRLERRRSRLGVLGVALFVCGPVLGTALAVVGAVVGLREDPRWWLLVVLGLGVGFGATFAGLRVLTRLERARSVGTSPMDDPVQPDSASPGRTGSDA
ncbi:hypothetical protein [Agromyces binzhouensis]|uniref:hypothetical protein n=1 Tax=Agromyces binzhouensis TaxID=1817495 RepID=UPI00363EDE29